MPICRVSGRLRPTPVRLVATLRGSGSCGVTVYFFFFEAVQEVVAVVDSIMGGAIEIHVLIFQKKNPRLLHSPRRAVETQRTSSTL